MSQKKQKYQDNYLDFGFTYLIEDDLKIPQSVVCMKTFSNSTMKPASLKQHLANAHPSMMSKNQFVVKLNLWRQRAKNNNFASFHRLTEITGDDFNKNLKEDIISHLRNLQDEFERYFS